MTFYDTHILPVLTHWVCSQKDIAVQRKKWIPLAEGRVLEVGFGSGLNLPFYTPAKVKKIWGLDPSPGLQKIAGRKVADMPFKIDLLAESGEEIPLENRSADTVVVTYTLCSIPDISKALKEMRRVLKPGGKLIFCEHGRSPENRIQKWQDRLNPAWKKISGGCHLNRHIPDLLKASGFCISTLETGYQSPAKLISFNYQGIAA